MSSDKNLNSGKPGSEPDRTPAAAGVLDRYVVAAGDAVEVLLNRIVSGSAKAPHTDKDQFFSYDSALNVVATIEGNKSSSSKQIRYNIQPRAARRNIPIASAGCVRLDGTIRLSDINQRDIADAARRNSALPSSFKRVDLLGVAERLASGLAHFASWGGLTANELRGGANASIRGIMAATENIAIDPASVFISKKLSDHLYPATFCALVCAVNGEGGMVYSDLVAIDGNGTVQFETYADMVLARGCYEALNMLGQMYVDANAGPAFALAVVRGCVKLRSLASHSDEGGYVRNVFRLGSYNAPYGGVLIGSSSSAYTGLPTPNDSLESFQVFVDSIILGSAAAVAIADPMVEVAGKAYPTVLTLYHNDADDPGVDPGTFPPRARTTMQMMWAAAARNWAVNYAQLLGVLFSAPGDTSRTVENLSLCAQGCVGSNDKHLDHHVVVPFYYVEPTSIWPKWIPSMKTMTEECGPLAIEGTTRSLAPFSGLKTVNTVSAESYTVDLDFRFMRRHPILVYCEQHRLDGMACIDLFSGTPNKFANVGGNGAMDARILSGDSLDTFVWGRLHSQVIGIGEFINLDSRLRLHVRHTTGGLAGRSWNHKSNNLPEITDLSGYVTYKTARPVFRSAGALVDDNRSWMRARSAAAQALCAAREKPKTMAGLGVQVRPTLGEPIPYVSEVGVDAEKLRLGGAAVGYTGFNDASGIEQVGAGILGTPGVTANGDPVPVTIEHVRDRGRRASAVGRGLRVPGPNVNVGGGGNNPNPNLNPPPGGGPPPPPPNPPGGGGGNNPPAGGGVDHVANILDQLRVLHPVVEIPGDEDDGPGGGVNAPAAPNI